MAATVPSLDEIRLAVREELFQALAPLRQDRDRELLPADEVARRMGVSVRTIQRWMQRGALPSVAVGRTRRVRAGDLDPGLLAERLSTLPTVP
jgi:excisionase family DNA binding protein